MHDRRQLQYNLNRETEKKNHGKVRVTDLPKQNSNFFMLYPIAPVTVIARQRRCSSKLEGQDVKQRLALHPT